MSDKPKCPHCGEAISMTLWAKAMDENRLVLSLTPTPGEHMAARTIGGSITELDKLLRAVGRNIGGKTIPLVERIETMESGEMRIHLLITMVRQRAAP